jgi:hypothetical protein
MQLIFIALIIINIRKLNFELNFTNLTGTNDMQLSEELIYSLI